ncbi:MULTISPECIES: LysE family translocator [Vibrio]|uniref:MFS transporter n=2 Tax=Vibrio genomosp. F10 TaxID=723171 RepID=A0A1B9QZA3_9VIBR|nr:MULTISPECIES: LysE family transporter [Vibrio]OCH76498.1 MFS transporter [Vibrio genomosp. F10]OEE37459.1 MFS transporter [Vibrio genomosp. F10 str. ZF-129]OEE92939.1 MFS transporter [Vibrio genomosp. F10 str. 9ZC157]OEE93198.1 MFS transporter [Vibrio genomosp. F10 str. 9ZD137]OEF07486.1 MFS transporter [Vibrio genomosp. F10 str. 9ZB36]
MDLIQGLILISSIHLLAAASPGPDFVLVSQQTLSNGKKAGLMCSIGIALGLSIHITYSAFGLATVIANSSNALWAIKILGGGYLIYLGINGLKAKATNSMEVDATPPATYSARKSIGVGFLCNALNPKAPIYFVSLFTVVLSPDMPAYQIAIYGAWIMMIQFAWFSLLVGILSRPAINRRFKQYGHWIDRVLGGAMVALGIKVIATRSS